MHLAFDEREVKWNRCPYQLLYFEICFLFFSCPHHH